MTATLTYYQEPISFLAARNQLLNVLWKHHESTVKQLYFAFDFCSCCDDSVVITARLDDEEIWKAECAVPPGIDDSCSYDELVGELIGAPLAAPRNASVH